MSNPPEQLSRRQAGWTLAALILAGAVLYVVAIWWGVPYRSATWAFDEITPEQVGSSWTILYPPAHRHVLWTLFAATYQLAESTGMAAPDHNTLLLVSRALSALMACLTAFLIYRCARRLSDRLTSLLAVAAVAFGTNFVFYAKTANLDIPYLFWFTLSLLFFLRSLDHGRWSDHLLFAVCGALAISTKTQAYALYLLAPVALVLNLRPPGVPIWRSFWRSLFDRRILLAAGAGIAVTLLVFGELRGSGGLREHVTALTSLDYEDFRTVALSPRGLFTLAVTALRQTGFVLGVPVFLAALSGLGMALARPRRNARLLSLLLFIVPYWLVFVAATGFNYDRHYLPIAVVLGIFAAKALAALAKAGPPLRALRLAAVGLVLAYAVWCGVSVDLMLLGDARLEAERWLADTGIRNKTFGLGPRERLPRGLPMVGLRQFARSRRGEFGTNPNVWHNCVALGRLDVEYLIPDSPWEMRGPGLNYREYRRFRNAARAPLANPTGVSTYASNIVKVFQDIVVFRRTPDECVDAALVPRMLDELRRANDPERRAQLALAISKSPLIRSVALAGKEMSAVRLHGDGWTAGTIPAGVVIQNLGWQEERPELLLRLSRPLAPYPVTAFVDDGAQTRSFLFERPGQQVVTLSPLAPDQRSLAIIWTDKSWTDEDGARRGIQLIPAAWPTDSETRRQQFYAALKGLTAGTIDESLRAELARAVGRGVIKDPVDLGPGALMAGGLKDGWTAGTEPAALLVHNPGRRPARVVLNWSCDMKRAKEPIVAFIDGAAGTQRFQLDCSREAREVSLGRLAPGAERLYVVWADRARLTTTAPVRLLGVRLKKVRLIDEQASR